MIDELTPREHDDMRDLLIAGSQRIRPAAARHALVPALTAVVLVGGVIAAMTSATLLTPRHAAPPAHSDVSPTTEGVRRMQSPLPTFRPWGETKQEPYVDVPTSRPTVPAPAPGEHLTLKAVPKMDNRLILGTGEWLDNQGIDIGSAQGFESIGAVWPWAARLKDQTGSCILIRNDDSQRTWAEVVCDRDGTRASVEREVDGALLRFTIVGNTIDVYNVPR